MIAPLLQGQNLLQYGQANSVPCPLLIIADFTFPIFDGVKPIALLSVRTSIPVLVHWCVGTLACWCVAMLACGYIIMPANVFQGNSP